MPTSAGRLAATSLTMAAFFVLYNVGLRYTDTITAAHVSEAVNYRLLDRGLWT